MINHEILRSKKDKLSEIQNRMLRPAKLILVLQLSNHRKSKMQNLKSKIQNCELLDSCYFRF